jgi:hypothetical protein
MVLPPRVALLNRVASKKALCVAIFLNLQPIGSQVGLEARLEERRAPISDDVGSNQQSKFIFYFILFSIFLKRN